MTLKIPIIFFFYSFLRFRGGTVEESREAAGKSYWRGKKVFAMVAITVKFYYDYREVSGEKTGGGAGSP